MKLGRTSFYVSIFLIYFDVAQRIFDCPPVTLSDGGGNCGFRKQALMTAANAIQGMHHPFLQRKIELQRQARFKDQHNHAVLAGVNVKILANTKLEHLKNPFWEFAFFKNAV